MADPRSGQDGLQGTPAVPRPIADHGVIGNLSTIALVARDATIDFLCWPHFDSPSVFCALLDTDRGGAWELTTDIADARVVQAYLPDSNLLLTRWLGDTASAEVLDLMTGAPEIDEAGPRRLVRQVRVTRGRAAFRMSCAPRFDYARRVPTARVSDGMVVFGVPTGPGLRLHGPTRFAADDGTATTEFALDKGGVATFVLDEPDDAILDQDGLQALIVGNQRRWQGWAARSTYKGHWRDAVTRSALVLKLLTSHRYGSIVAAGTFGLPEVPGGERNWDYRATWIRDASFSVYSLMRLGYQMESMAFTRWAAERAADCPRGSLAVMYTIDGLNEAKEQDLPHLAGYGGAKPVRVGNDASTQVQLDIYGALLDSIYLSNKYGEAISHADWSGVCRVVDFVCENWQRADAGIWESREGPLEHLHSRLMCWVAVDRAVRLATKRSLNAPFGRWIDTRNRISDDIWTNFWNAERGHFVRSKGSDELDGALLMMPLVRFVSATDPAWLSTLDAIGERLSDDGLVKRYDRRDGLDGREGSFATCAFWYVECLARAGRVEQARTNFERLLSYGNHVQLYAEEFSPRAEPLGNFPQALTHLALISAAFALDRALEGQDQQQWRA